MLLGPEILWLSTTLLGQEPQQSGSEQNGQDRDHRGDAEPVVHRGHRSEHHEPTTAPNTPAVSRQPAADARTAF